MSRLLLLGNSKNRNEPYLGHAEEQIRRLLGKQTKTVLFIPYARVMPSFDIFASIAKEAFDRLGYRLTSIHTSADPQQAIGEAEAIVIGGGNTFHLLQHLYEGDLLHAIRKRVETGTPFIGWSAGANVACPTIKTTNDMPIVEPQSLSALALIPFQINPHFVDCSEDPTAETRTERLTEFIEVNTDVYVVGLREGSILSVESGNVELLGPLGACVFSKGQLPREYRAGEAIDFLLSLQEEVCSLS